MSTTHNTTPSPDELRELPTAELGVTVLRAVRAEFSIHSMINGHNQAHRRNGEPDVDHLLARISDAFAWLIGEGLIGPAVNQDTNTWYRVTDRGRHVREAQSISTLLADQRLPDDLHPHLAEARRQFRGGNSELAVFEAMKRVEVHVRTQASLPSSVIGVALARKALHPETGPLSNQDLDGGERQAIADLFAGALGTFKNPTSHRIVDFEDPALAADAILLADLLLRLIDQLPIATEVES